MQQKLFLSLIIVMLVFLVGWKPESLLKIIAEPEPSETTEGQPEKEVPVTKEPIEEGDWLKTETSFDPLFKDVYLACQGISTAQNTLAEIYGASREIAQAHGLKQEAEKEILAELGNRRSELNQEQLAYFADALINLGTANQQAKTSLETCQNLQPRLQKAIEAAPVELALQPWKIKKVVRGLKGSLVQVTNASREGAILVQELAQVTSLVQKITM